MPFDALFLIAIGGMVLAVLVIAVFFRPAETDNAEDLPAAIAAVAFEDDLALLRRHACPDCGAVLRQEVFLHDPGQPRQTAQEEIGLPPGPARCPSCGMHLNIEVRKNKSD